ncbi:hypothetical protein [Legionella maioricensis]|uniref:Uncharacterized protein n=1 Tax=Legionella maioricensis TaxID=2896528 RepID=A0A9X2D2K4_9GAMM|nr:hypothetical protein [Legionella maioricensis]MCL9685303.1 hypothetical protein [Legionella maioricensis]MCL9688558.1 hypothetical protein [Legionella maioricensis]
MNKTYSCCMVLIAFFVSSLAHAFSDSYVTDWAQKTLIETLTVSYLTTPEETEATQKKYSLAAWEPMSAFFNKELIVIDQQKLSTHPKPLTEPTITKLTKCISDQCWRVNQSFNIPELHMNIDFSLLLVTASPGGYSPFLIQSVDMNVHRY